MSSRKYKSLRHIAQISPLWSPLPYITHLKKLNLAWVMMSQANWTHRCGYSGLVSVPPCVRESATSILLSKWKWEQCQRTQPATKCDFLWVNVVTRPGHVTTQHEESLVESFMASGYYQPISMPPLSMSTVQYSISVSTASSNKTKHPKYKWPICS